jgi:hypothetical protein
MDSKDLDVLRDIHQIVEVPHAAQELLVAERTLTLSMALPSCELLKSKWSELRTTIWELSHYIGIGPEKLYCALIRSQQNSQLHVQLPPLSGRDSALAAAQSLMAGFGRITRINTSVRRSSFTSRPQTPLLSPSPPPVEVESISAMSPEERARRDLEQDRKDAERELTTRIWSTRIACNLEGGENDGWSCRSPRTMSR